MVKLGAPYGLGTELNLILWPDTTGATDDIDEMQTWMQTEESENITYSLNREYALSRAVKVVCSIPYADRHVSMDLASNEMASI